MSETKGTTIETDPPAKPEKSSKGVGTALAIIFIGLWATWGFMRKPASVGTIQEFTELDQQAFVLSDGQGSGGLGTTTDVSDQVKQAQDTAPKPMGQKGVWYTFYPPMDKDEAIKKEVRGGNGWTLVNQNEERYTWRGKYDIKLRAPATSKEYNVGIQFMENDGGIGGTITSTLRNMLP